MTLKHNKATAVLTKMDAHRGILLLEFENTDGQIGTAVQFIKTEKSNELINKSRKLAIDISRGRDCQLGVFKVSAPKLKIFIISIEAFSSLVFGSIQDAIDGCKNTHESCSIWFGRNRVGTYLPGAGGFIEDPGFTRQWN